MEASPPRSTPPLADAAQAETPRSNAPAWVAFALPPLASAAWLAWAALTLGNAEAEGGRAYDMMLYGIGGAGLTGIAAIAVLIWAGLRGYVGRALLALLAGLLLAPLLLWFGAGAVLSARRKDFEQRQELVNQLAETVRRGDAARIRAAIDALPDRPGPARALCMLQGRRTYRLVHWVWFDEHANGPQLSSAELLTAAAAVVDGPASAQVKQTTLRTALLGLIEQNEPARFGAWAALWRRTLAQPAAGPVLLAAEPDAQGDCSYGDPLDFALSRWLDDGVRAWIDAGFGFAEERSQPLSALRAVRRPGTLRALLAADPQFARMLREDRDAGEEALSAQADSLSATLDASDRPQDAAELVEALHAAGARPRTIGLATSCELFEAGEKRRGEPRDTPQRQAAAERVRAVLCPHPGKPTKPAKPAHAAQPASA